VTQPAGSRPPERLRVTPGVRDRAITGLLVAVLAVAAFAIAIPRPPAPLPGESAVPNESASATPVAGDVVYREGVVGRPTSITPITARTRADRTLVGLIFSGLVKMGPGDTLVPDIAQSWKADKSGQTWTVKLRTDAKWQDGQPVTADDVAFTVSALKDPAAAGGLAATWADVSVEKIDDTTVRFTLGAPVGGFLAALTQPLLPSHLLSDVAMSDLAGSDFALNPVGSGPYELTQLDDAHAVLVPSTSGPLAGASPKPSGGTDGAGPGDPGAGSPPAGSATPEPQSAAPRLPSATPDSPSAPASSSSESPSDSGQPASASPSPAAGSASPSAAGDASGQGSAANLALASKSPKPTAKATAKPSTTPAPTPTVAPTATPDPAGKVFAKIEIDFLDTEDALAAAFTAGQIDAASGLSADAAKALAGTANAKVVDYPTTTLTAVLLNLRPTHPELQDPNVRKALLGGIDRSTIATTDLSGQGRVADTLVPPESWAYDKSRVVKIAYDRVAASKLLTTAGWKKVGGKWTAPKAKAPYAIEVLTVPSDVNPRLAAVAAAVKRDWTRMGFTVTVTSLSGSQLASRLKAGTFTAAVLDISTGLEPDLYPLLDSTQVRANGSNRSGFQDPAMDLLLEAARRYGSLTRRRTAWGSLLGGLSEKLPVLPVVWADEQMAIRGLSGNTTRLIVHTGDRFWDVLAWRLAASR
jgi:ABC-type transport system substrate-binding protein